MTLLGKKIGIDLGTATSRLHLRGEGTIVTEPSAVAVDADTGRVLSIGSAAQQVSDRAGITLRRPLREGQVVDRVAAEAMLGGLVHRAAGRQRIFRPDVMVSVSSGLAGTERRFLLDVASRAGARTAYLIDSPLAAALGAGLAVSAGTGRLIVDVGAGSVEAAVIAAEGMVAWKVSSRGAARLTAEIGGYVGGLRDADVAMADAEELKREIGCATRLAEERTLRIPARRGGEPVELVVSSVEVHSAIVPWLRDITQLVRDVLDECPPRLARDVRERTGLTLAGGGAALRGLERHLAAALRLPVNVAGDPAGCVARGAGAALENLDVLRRSFLYVR
jgi:rod shape-determining protein MreB and related proteins